MARRTIESPSTTAISTNLGLVLLLVDVQPDLTYHLPAQSRVQGSFELSD